MSDTGDDCYWAAALTRLGTIYGRTWRIDRSEPVGLGPPVFAAVRRTDRVRLSAATAAGLETKLEQAENQT